MNSSNSDNLMDANDSDNSIDSIDSNSSMNSSYSNSSMDSDDLEIVSLKINLSHFFLKSKLIYSETGRKIEISYNNVTLEDFLNNDN